MTAPQPVSPLPPSTVSQMHAARSVSETLSSVTPLTTASSPSPSAPTNVTSPAPQSRPAQLAIPSPSTMQPQTQWTQRTAATGRVYLADRATGKTKWLWQKFSVKGKIFCENALTRERAWPEHMDLALKIVSGMATEEERKEWKASAKKVEVPAPQSTKALSPTAVKQSNASERGKAATEKSSKVANKADGDRGKCDASPAEEAESSKPCVNNSKPSHAVSVPSEGPSQASTPASKNEIDKNDKRSTESEDRPLQLSPNKKVSSVTPRAVALNTSAMQSKCEQATGQMENKESEASPSQSAAEPEALTASTNVTAKQDTAESSVALEKQSIVEAEATDDASKMQQLTKNSKSDHEEESIDRLAEMGAAQTGKISDATVSVRSKVKPKSKDKGTSIMTPNEVDSSLDVLATRATGVSTGTLSTSTVREPTLSKDDRPSTVVSDPLTIRNNLTEVQGIAFELDKKEAIYLAQVERIRTSASPHKAGENLSPTRDILGEHAAAASAAAAAATLRAGADALERSGTVRLAVDTVERMQLDAPHGALSPRSGATSPRARASIEHLSPRVVGRLAAEKLEPYLTPDKQSGSGSGSRTRLPDRATPSPVASRTSATTTTPRSPSSRRSITRAPSFGRRSEPTTPGTLPAPRARSFTRRDAPATPPAGRTRSFSRRVTGPPSTTTTPRGGATGSAPGTPRGGRLSIFARSARRLVTSSNPVTPIANATRRVFDSGTPRLTTPEPFYLRSIERHERAQKQLLERERRRIEEENEAVKPFKALPMPDFNR